MHYVQNLTVRITDEPKKYDGPASIINGKQPAQQQVVYSVSHHGNTYVIGEVAQSLGFMSAGETGSNIQEGDSREAESIMD